MAKPQQTTTWVGLVKVPGAYGRYQACIRRPGQPPQLLGDPEPRSMALDRATGALEDAYLEHGAATDWPAPVLAEEPRRAG